MKNINRKLIRESLDYDTGQKDHIIYNGKLISKSNMNIYNYAFIVDEKVMRLTIEFLENGCKIIQNYSDSTSEIELFTDKIGKYCLNLSTGHQLFLQTEGSLIKHDDLKINLKYNLLEEVSKKVISFNEITIIGE